MFFKPSKVCAIFLFGIGITGVHGQPENKTDYYLGQKPPGIVPEVFAPGIISEYVHGTVAISPRGDEIYWVVNPSTERIVYSKWENGVWTKPAVADFVKDYLTSNNGGSAFECHDKKIAGICLI